MIRRGGEGRAGSRRALSSPESNAAGSPVSGQLQACHKSYACLGAEGMRAGACNYYQKGHSLDSLGGRLTKLRQTSEETRLGRPAPRPHSLSTAPLQSHSLARLRALAQPPGAGPGGPLWALALPAIPFLLGSASDRRMMHLFFSKYRT